jgi:hypothetical protein
MAASGASDEAIKAKPKADVGRRMDSSANFEKYPVRVLWRIETTKGDVMTQGEAEVRSGAAAASFEMQIDQVTLKRIAASKQSVVPVVNVTPIGSPGTMASREIRGSHPLTVRAIWDSGVIGKQPAEYRFASVRESGKPSSQDEFLVFSFVCNVTDRDAPARSAPYNAQWELAASSGGVPSFAGATDGMLRDGSIVIKIPKSDAAVMRLYEDSAPTDEDAPTFSLSLTVQIGKESRTCKSSPIERPALRRSNSGGDSAELGSKSGT